MKEKQKYREKKQTKPEINSLPYTEETIFTVNNKM